MNIRKIILYGTIFGMGACTQYSSPNRNTWSQYLYGASFSDMTETTKTAKLPVYMGHGGKIVTASGALSPNMQYGDKNDVDNTVLVNYMAKMEYELYDSLRKPGISVQRAGTDIVVILVRDAIMSVDIADISSDGADTLDIITKILNKYNATFLEIAGYTDSMNDKNAANALSLDMAQRVGVYFAQNKVSTSRMFIVGRGSARPIAAQDDIGRLMNRRVEIRISPAR
ncbi:MAG: OmpA family protein [Alphaproteobacteria bacterium]|nr:OmpA family protein [Alphaproteobacteria bacterium]